MSLRPILLPLCLFGVVAMTSPANAQTGPAQAAAPMAMPPIPMAEAPAQSGVKAPPGWDSATWDRARGDWLQQCRRRYAAGRNGTVLGAVLGGVAGGVIGNQIAGRDDRAVGTVAGAVFGSVAGGTIGSSADRSRARDYCENYLEDYVARYGQYDYGQPGMTYGYAMQPMAMMVPVMMVQPQSTAQPRRECRENEVIEEWVPMSTRSRVIPRRPALIKRTRVIPDKRVPID